MMVTLRRECEKIAATRHAYVSFPKHPDKRIAAVEQVDSGVTVRAQHNWSKWHDANERGEIRQPSCVSRWHGEEN